MCENMSSAPYIIQIDEPLQTIHLTEQIESLGIQLNPNSQKLLNNPQIFIESPENPIEIVQEAPIQAEQPCIFQIVYPQDLNLSPANSVIKRGRPKKKKIEDSPKNESTKVQAKTELVTPQLPKTARTRSGRLVKLPKYIEKDFKKIEVTADEQEIQVSDFKRFEEKENTKLEFAELHAKKRTISAQYKCPKCFKAYLGKSKMIQHLKKYPDHGPLPEGFPEFNFDVWNYLFDITQKCKSGQRGAKFCEELSNLLHNVQLLKSALFKTVTDNKNCVHIDKVLGNAIGLTPGKYKFDENELYKDVTVLKLITNSDFFKPNNNLNNKKQPESDNIQLEEPSENKKLKPDQNFTITRNDQENTSLNGAKETENIYNYSDKFVENTDVKMQEQTIQKTEPKQDIDNQILQTDLLTENLLLHSLPNSRNTVEELMLTDNGSNLLDNSTSSDEVMNVDQFVNERFKKIIEPDIELGNTSLNLDLPDVNFISWWLFATFYCYFRDSNINLGNCYTDIS